MENIAIEFLTKGQVALEGNFGFVLDKSDLKSASDKKSVRKATVALQNKICEQNTTPCCERLVISAHSWTKSFSSSLLHLSWALLFSADEDARGEEDGVDAGIELFSLNWGILAKRQYSWSEMGWDFLDH